MARKAGIQLEEIVDVAAAIADREGLDGATLGAVAAALGIKPPSLHYRVGGSSGLRRLLAFRSAVLMEDLFRQQLDSPDPVRGICRAYRDFGLRHPGLYDAMLPAARPDDNELFEAQARPVQVAVEALTNSGIAQDDLIHRVRVIRSALHGFIDNERRGGFGMPVDVDTSFDHLLDLIAP